MNKYNIDIELQAGRKIGELCPLVETLDHSSSAHIASQLEAKTNPDLSAADRNTLLQASLKFSEFSETVSLCIQ